MSDERSLALALVTLGAALVFELSRRGARHRVGPWPGLTWSGAGVLLGCGAALAGVQLWLGSPQRAWPDLGVLTVSSLVPLVVATRIVWAPGAASAACGAYLLPRSLIALVNSSVEPPPLVLVGAMAFDVVLWVRRTDVALKRPRRRNRQPRQPSLWRGTLAGAAFGLAFVLVEPAYAVLLGAEPSAFGPSTVLASAVMAACVCSLIGALSRSGPRTGSAPTAAPTR